MFSPLIWIAVLSFTLVPLLDALFGETFTSRPVSRSVVRRRIGNILYGLLLARTPLTIGLLLWAGLSQANALSAGPAVGVGVALGVLNAATGTIAAHELMHRKSRLARGTADLLMTLACYPHFVMTHVFGHHRTVGTEEDPATARRGEPVYSFLIRSVVGGYRQFLKLEAMRRRGRHIGVISLRNRALRGCRGSLSLSGACGCFR